MTEVTERLPSPHGVVTPESHATSRALRWRSLVTWGSQGMWAIVDQALFAGSNLLVNVLLARWLPRAEYGAFVTAYTVLLLVQIGHSALLIEPMLIFGADKHQESFSHYLSVLVRYHWRLAAAVSACLATAGVSIALATDLILGRAIGGLTVIAPFILLSWLARRACYGASRPRLAAIGGAINMTIVAIGIALLARLHLLSVFSGQLLLGVAALATTLSLLPRLGRVTDVPLEAAARSSVWSDHWKYARWSIATGACSWFYTFTYYLVLPAWGGLAASGSLKALLNLIMPILHSDGALVTLLLPNFVRSQRVPGRFRRIVLWATAGFSVEAALYWIGLVIFGPSLVTWLYGGTYEYDHAAIVMIGVLPLLTSSVNILSNALRAREQPEGVFWATVSAAVVTGTFGVAAVAFAGIDGAILGMAGSSAAQIVVMLWLLSRRPSSTLAAPATA